MQLIPVRSTVISAIGYDNGQMQVNFRNKEIIVYQGIPSQLFTNFLNAKSKGKFYGMFIRGKYPSVKIH